MLKKCTGESGDIDDIAKNVNIAMQKNDMRKESKCLNSLKSLMQKNSAVSAL